MRIALKANISLLLVLSLSLPVFGTTKGDIKKGKQLYESMQCVLCHTDGGNNLNPERPVKGNAFLKRFPATADGDKALIKLIREGVPSKGMPDFGKDKMSDQDMSDLIAYIRSLTPATSKK